MVNSMRRSFLAMAMFFSCLAPVNTMADEPFVGEVRWFAGNFAPRGWEFCNGQLLPIPQNTALFSLLGTIYGGDGRTTFALPDMRSRFPVHAGRGNGLSERRIGAKGGQESVVLTDAQMASHAHGLQATTGRGNTAQVSNSTLSRLRRDRYYDSVAAENPADVQMSPNTVTDTGGNQAHSNLNPYVGVNCIIATVGVYPSRN